MERLLDTLRRLRAPDGCPWDREQTHDSLRPHLLEEAAEAVDALGSGRDADVVDELGDVLLQVAFHAVIAEEDGRYDYDAIEGAIRAKLVRRHPHVFGDVRADDAAAVEAQWARIKDEERRESGREPRAPGAGVPRSLPALARAAALGEALGWSSDGPEREALRTAASNAEASDPETLGRALLALALRASDDGHDPEILLRDALAARLAGDGR